MAVLLTLLFSAGGAILVYQIDVFARAQSSRHLLDAARMSSLLIDGELRRDIGILEALGTTDAVRRRDWKAVDDFARKLPLAPDSWIAVGDRYGNQLVNTHLPAGVRLPKAPSIPGLWRDLDTGRSRACNLGRGMVEKAILCVDLPIMEGSRAAYHLTMVFRPKRMANLFMASRSSYYQTIADRNGVVIWRNHDPDKYIGRHIRPFLQRALARSAEGVTAGKTLDGVDTEIAFSRSAFSGWTFILAAPSKEIAAPSFDTLQLGLLISASLLLLAILIAGWMTRRVQKAIGQLNRAATRIAAGESPDYQPSGMLEIDAVGGNGTRQ